MELNEGKTAKVIRAAGSVLSVLSDSALAEIWEIYCRETSNRFWAECQPGEILGLVAWVDRKPYLRRMVETAREELAERKKMRALARQVRPRPRFVQVPDADEPTDPRVYRGDLSAGSKRTRPSERLISVRELVESTNRWCTEHGVVPSLPESKPVVDEQMVRLCCSNSLLDRPGSALDGRTRGFSAKHVAQLRAIRILQSRSLSLREINTVLYGRSLAQLHEIEVDELARVVAPSSRTPQRIAGGEGRVPTVNGTK